MIDFESMAPGAITSKLLAEAPSGLAIRRVVPMERQIPLSRTVHVRGFLPAGEGKKSIAFESLLEKRFVSQMLAFPEVEEIVSQPVTIHYSIDGREHRYTPDYQVKLVEVPDSLKALGFNKATFVECKPVSKIPEQARRLSRHFQSVGIATRMPILTFTDSKLHAALLAGGVA